MRWLFQQAEFFPGFLPTDFITTPGANGPDPNGIRTILLDYVPEGYVQVMELSIVPDEALGDYAVKCLPAHVGLVRMREIGTNTWVPVTNSLGSTFTRKNVSSFFNVEVEMTVPTGTDPADILLYQLWQLVGTL